MSITCALLLVGDASLVWLYLRETLPRHCRTELHGLLTRTFEPKYDDDNQEEDDESGEGEGEGEQEQLGLSGARLWNWRFVRPLVITALLEYHLGYVTLVSPTLLP